MPRLTILITSLGEPKRFEETLVSVLEHRPRNVEILVVHSQPYDDPYRLRGEVRFVEVTGALDLSKLVNTGFEASRSPIVHVLTAGLCVQPEWIDSLLPRFANEKVASVAPLVVHENRIVTAGISYSRGGRHYWQGSGMNLGSREKISPQAIVGPTIHAGVFRRDLFLSCGGLDESIGDDLADLEIALALRTRGFCSEAATSALVVTTTKLDAPREDIAPTFDEARRSERLFWRYLPTEKRVVSLLMHPLMIAIESIGSLPNPRAFLAPMGRLLSMVEPRGTRKSGVIPKGQGASPSKPPVEPSRTIRMDGSHVASTTPHKTRERVRPDELPRKAA